jgi:hypothetical protein
MTGHLRVAGRATQAHPEETPQSGAQRKATWSNPRRLFGLPCANDERRRAAHLPLIARDLVRVHRALGPTHQELERRLLERRLDELLD